MLFDSHAHYDDKRFNSDRHELLTRIHHEGVEYIVNAASDMQSSHHGVKLSEKYPFVYCAVGVHPHDVKDMTSSDLVTLETLSNNPKVVAIGEIGLDYYYEYSERQAQKKWFIKQIELAQKLDLPVIIHERDACEDCMTIVSERKFRGVFHCFSGSKETAKELLQMGFYLSFGGPVTFNNSNRLKDVVANVPIEKMFIETDCPYLTPVPHRGERNHSGYVHLVAAKIAEIKNMEYDDVVRITCENAREFFNI